MSFVSTYSAASIRGYSASTLSKFVSIETVSANGNANTRYWSVCVSKSDVGNGQFVATKNWSGNVSIKKIGDSFSKSFTTNISTPIYGTVVPGSVAINEQGNLVITYTGNATVGVFEYNGSNYSLIQTITKPSVADTEFGLQLAISGNANVLVIGTVEGFASNTYYYTRSGNNFTFAGTIFSGQGSEFAINNAGNIVAVTSNIASTVSIYEDSGNGYVLGANITTPNANINAFGGDLCFNDVGNIINIFGGNGVGSTRYIWTYSNIANTWTQTANKTTNYPQGSQFLVDSAIYINSTGNINLIPQPAGTSNIGNVQVYNGNTVITQTLLPSTTANYANSYYGYKVAGDNAGKYIAITNQHTGNANNFQVMDILQLIT
jgi:hypothetical protein